MIILDPEYHYNINHPNDILSLLTVCFELLKESINNIVQNIHIIILINLIQNYLFQTKYGNPLIIVN